MAGIRCPMEHLLVEQQFTSQLLEGVTFQQVFGSHFDVSSNHEAILSIKLCIIYFLVDRLQVFWTYIQ